MSGFDLDAVRLRQLLTDASKKLGPEEFEALAYMFREQDRLIEESQSVYEETGLTPRQLAEQRAALLEALDAVVMSAGRGKAVLLNHLLDQCRAAIALAQGDEA